MSQRPGHGQEVRVRVLFSQIDISSQAELYLDGVNDEMDYGYASRILSFLCDEDPTDLQNKAGVKQNSIIPTTDRGSRSQHAATNSNHWKQRFLH